MLLCLHTQWPKGCQAHSVSMSNRTKSHSKTSIKILVAWPWERVVAQQWGSKPGSQKALSYSPSTRGRILIGCNIIFQVWLLNSVFLEGIWLYFVVLWRAKSTTSRTNKKRERGWEKERVIVRIGLRWAKLSIYLRVLDSQKVKTSLASFALFQQEHSCSPRGWTPEEGHWGLGGKGQEKHSASDASVLQTQIVFK